MLMTLISETNNTHVILLSQYDSICVLFVEMNEWMDEMGWWPLFSMSHQN